MRNNFFNRKIPTLLGIGAVAVIAIVTAILARSNVLVIGNAASVETPGDVRITNLSDSSFTVTYKTPNAVLGSISYGTDQNTPQIAIDDRDQNSGTQNQYQLHSMTLHNLSANTKYYFSIKSGATTFLNNNELFQLTTPPNISTLPSSEKPLTGKIIGSNGKPPGEILIFVQSANGQILSTLAKSDGLYTIALNTMRDKGLTSYTSYNDPINLQILALNNTQASQVNFTINNDNSVSIVTLGQNYDFTTAQKFIASDTNNVASLFSLPSATPSNLTPQITSPKNNSQTIDLQPLIRGTAKPNSQVLIAIHSMRSIQTTINTDKLGNWQFRPATPLSPGTHIITVIAKDASGLAKTIQQSFTVYAQGSQVLPAFVSPTNTPTPPKPTNTPTPTVKLSSTPTTAVATNTPTIAATSSPTLSPTSSTSATPSHAMMSTGNGSLIIIGFGSIIAMLSGLFLLLATRAGSML